MTASIVSMGIVILIAATPVSPYHPVLPRAKVTPAPPRCSPGSCSWTKLPHGILIALGSRP